MPTGQKNSVEQSLAKFQREFGPGEFLYKQGAMGNTMFIVLTGTLHLIRERRGEERIIATVGAGEVLGEKALINKSPYRHSLTAVATTHAVCLELSAEDFHVLQAKMPDFAIKVIRVVSDRLEEANELIAILQSDREIERVVTYLLFFSKYHAKKVPQGLEVKLSSRDISFTINVPEDDVREILTKLVQARALLQKDDNYIIHDATLLEQQITENREAA